MAFWDMFRSKGRKFTVEEVKDLIERIKEFNAGAVDKQLSKHADRVLEQWLDEKK